MRLARNVASRRAEMELSQEALAAEAGLHRTYVGAIERGERNVTLATIELLSEVLGCDPMDLLAEVD